MGRKKKNDWKNRDGVVYSTDDSFSYDNDSEDSQETLAPSDQRLRIYFEKRKGKSVTVVEGFEGTADDLKDLGRDLKNYCGVGGSAKDHLILLQGDFREKVKAHLLSLGYRVR